MKNNVLIIGFPIYALLDFYKKKLEQNFLNYNFYIITDNIGISQEYFNELSLLKKKKIITNFFLIPSVYDNLFFKNFSKIRSFFIAKKCFFSLKKTNFNKIICSDFSKPEIRFIVNNLNNIYNSTIISVSIHNFKLFKEIEYNFLSLDNFIIIIKKIIQLRTNIKRLYLYIQNLFLNIISISILQENFIYFNKSEFFPLYHKKLKALVSNKEMEIYAYSRKFRNLKIFNLSVDKSCKCPNNFKYNKKLLVVLEILENKKQYANFMIDKFLHNILLLNTKFKFSSIDIKIHPRDTSLNSERLKEKILLMGIKVKTLDKNSFLSEAYCQYSCVLGSISSIMISAIDQCKNILVFGILEIANKVCINPKPKYVSGDVKNFKSGIIWIEDTPNFYKLSVNELLVISNKIKNEKNNNNFQFKNFEDLLEL
jgi:hypothetical protein